MPRNSASWGIGTAVAAVSGPRTVIRATPRWRVTTIFQRAVATERNTASGTLRACQAVSTSGDGDGRGARANSSAARFMTHRRARLRHLIGQLPVVGEGGLEPPRPCG